MKTVMIKIDPDYEGAVPTRWTWQASSVGAAIRKALSHHHDECATPAVGALTLSWETVKPTRVKMGAQEKLDAQIKRLEAKRAKLAEAVSGATSE